MKKAFLSLVVALVAVISFTGCNNNAPKAVAEKFLNSFWHMEYAEAKKVSTPATKQMIEMLETLSTKIPDADRQNAKKVVVEIKDVKEEGDKAVVTYITSEMKEEKKLNMVKENGQWLVNFTKNDNMMEEEAPAADGTDTTGVASPAPVNDTASK